MDHDALVVPPRIDQEEVLSSGFVSVIIFSKNRSFQLHKCLESLHRFVTVTSKHEMQVNVLYTGKYVCLCCVEPSICRCRFWFLFIIVEVKTSDAKLSNIMEGSYKQLRSIWEPRGVHFVRETNFAQQLKTLVRGLCKTIWVPCCGHNAIGLHYYWLCRSLLKYWYSCPCWQLKPLNKGEQKDTKPSGHVLFVVDDVLFFRSFVLRFLSITKRIIDWASQMQTWSCSHTIFVPKRHNCCLSGNGNALSCQACGEYAVHVQRNFGVSLEAAPGQ